MQFNAHIAEDVQRELPIVDALGYGSVFEERA
jgi:hypothetical protein